MYILLYLVYLVLIFSIVELSASAHENRRPNEGSAYAVPRVFGSTPSVERKRMGSCGQAKEN